MKSANEIENSSLGLYATPGVSLCAMRWITRLFCTQHLSKIILASSYYGPKDAAYNNYLCTKPKRTIFGVLWRCDWYDCKAAQGIAQNVYLLMLIGLESKGACISRIFLQTVVYTAYLSSSVNDTAT